MADWEIRRLEGEVLREVYRTHLKADFPPEERKPLFAVERLVKGGQYDTLGLYQGKHLLAYAFLWRDREGRCVLLDYLAVCRGGRGEGVGSGFLRLLEEHYRAFDGILVESEAPGTEASPEENAVRRRRMDFYARAGFRKLDYEVRLFGVHYVVLASGTLSSADALAAHRRHYRQDRFPPMPAPRTSIPYSPPEWREDNS
ncbi:GNAT family N-acetyltransferase [Lawsonibacter faecis]|uniref:N-acetyltransferase n=1 Tax=Lawsonibacter faecis TaxID=2763052 RepID=A0A8J6JGR1_9FIRM|nr:GNAT family N-acetyltransferase [Lawsonibacter faecis]MBC5735803.1 N-acetyltransferase [Lawsonibacter faecis]